jgi:hypothetical protein
MRGDGFSSNRPRADRGCLMRGGASERRFRDKNRPPQDQPRKPQQLGLISEDALSERFLQIGAVRDAPLPDIRSRHAEPQKSTPMIPSS